MMNVRFLAVPWIAVAAAATAGGAAAQSIEAGKAKAQQMCAACHGPQGITTMAATPNLAGQPELYLAQQLRDYKSKKRSHEVMAVIAQTLGDEDLANVAAFYASIKIKVDDAK